MLSQSYKTSLIGTPKIIFDIYALELIAHLCEEKARFCVRGSVHRIRRFCPSEPVEIEARISLFKPSSSSYFLLIMQFYTLGLPPMKDLAKTHCRICS